MSVDGAAAGGDVHAIQSLKARYARAVDDAAGDPAGAISRLEAVFLPDAEGDYGHGPLRGARALAEFLTTSISANSAWVLHMIHSPLIAIDGDRATGEWTVMVHLKRRAGGQVDVMIGRYADGFRRTADGWRIERVGFASLGQQERA